PAHHLGITFRRRAPAAQPQELRSDVSPLPRRARADSRLHLADRLAVVWVFLRADYGRTVSASLAFSPLDGFVTPHPCADPPPSDRAPHDGRGCRRVGIRARMDGRLRRPA